jgi:antitoxin HicB
MKRFNFAYPARLERQRETVIVRFPNLPEALTEGSDDAEALAEAADCLEEAIAGRIHRGENIPVPSRPLRGQRMVPLAPSMAAKAALYLALREARISKQELATRLGCDEKEVRRLLDPRHPSKLPRLQEALAQLGRRLVVEMRAA